MAELVRMQMMIEKQDQIKLQQIARTQGTSVSEILRKLVKTYLDEQHRAEVERFQAMLEQVEEIRQRNAARYGVYSGDLLRAVREEHEREKDEQWQSLSSTQASS
ncbi:MAG: hypothetical protein N3D16_04330 [Anaerolineales bacterium]|nr:hypothetical protein [Anaerolineales bacterium]